MPRDLTHRPGGRRCVAGWQPVCRESRDRWVLAWESRVAGRRGGALRSHPWGANRTTADTGDPAAHRQRALGASDVPAVVWPHYLTRSL